MKFSAVLDASRDVADALVQADPTWSNQLVDQLTTTLGADTVGLASYLRDGLIDAKSVNSGGPPLSAEERVVSTEYRWEYPFMQRFILTGDGTAARNSDLVASMRSFRSTTTPDHRANSPKARRRHLSPVEGRHPGLPRRGGGSPPAR